ncbi:AI-2E family transporter [Nocardiopsis sp. NRRL B-16309]|uniref:AI-2E family transporter n=1 Tax=Nocardiopsis sp. NRRL B-16309 TaxID=1519494 RepID=UPI0006C1BBD0|nr:AI-2E family transporter [Nocardiopsis sp. NRRL B-16309]KOX11885.1 membrane protein [Nocardiopsis sp. NRRL B-16309]
MPPWLPRAMMLAMWIITAFGVVLWLFLQLQGLIVLLLISLFLALALEPAVNWLHRHHWPRGLATSAVMLLVLVLTGAFLSLLGSMLIGQVLAFAAEVPAMLRAGLRWFNTSFGTDYSPTNLIDQVSSATGVVEQYASSIANNVLGAGTTVLALLFNGLTIALFTFYLCADGPRFRRVICSVLPPRTQREVLRAWEIAIDKTGGYLYSRALMALVCAVAHWVLLVALDIPYAVALALWVGVLSQFIPTAGTYIGGAVPVLVALLQGPWAAVWVLVFVIVYQQFENYLLQPRITAKTLDMHPAVAFGSVLAGVAILGAPGALLALPMGASLQAFIGTYIRRYEVAEHPLLSEAAADPDAESADDGAPDYPGPEAAPGRAGARDAEGADDADRGSRSRTEAAPPDDGRAGPERRDPS